MVLCGEVFSDFEKLVTALAFKGRREVRERRIRAASLR
jgi:hypothetical protein